MLASVQSKVSDSLGVRVPVLGAAVRKIKESLLLSIMAGGLSLFLASALVLVPFGQDVVGALLAVIGFNVALISFLGYILYHVLDRVV